MELITRAATPDDARAIDVLLSLCRGTDATGEAARRLGQPDSRAALVMLDGTAAGFAHLWCEADEWKCFARVRPDHVGRGAGAALLGWAQQGTRGLLTVTAPATDDAAPGLLRSHGFGELRYFLRMTVDLDRADPATGPVPPGLRLGGMTGDDRPRLYLAWAQAFADRRGPTALDEARWWRERPADTAGWLVARAGCEVAGFCLSWPVDGVGYVGDLGVRPAWRGQGLGYALLTGAFARFAGLGYERVTLHVDAANVTGAVRLYRKAGMRPDPVFTIWGKTV